MPPAVRHPLMGERAPSLPDVGRAVGGVGLPGGSAVKATVVDFMASWCAGCREAMPVIEALYRDRRGDGLQVIGINIDEPTPTAPHGAPIEASFPIFADPTQRLASQFSVTWVPCTFVLDRQGTVRWVGSDLDSLQRAVDVVLGE